MICRWDEPRYTRSEPSTGRTEKRAFEERIDFITERRRRHPGPARVPLQPLQADVGRPPHRGARDQPRGRRPTDGRFATREDEVDDLFRRGVFVDPYPVAPLQFTSLRYRELSAPHPSFVLS